MSSASSDFSKTSTAYIMYNMVENSGDSTLEYLPLSITELKRLTEEGQFQRERFMRIIVDKLPGLREAYPQDPKIQMVTDTITYDSSKGRYLDDTTKAYRNKFDTHDLFIHLFSGADTDKIVSQEWKKTKVKMDQEIEKKLRSYQEEKKEEKKK